ncbi:MAG: transketolase [Bacteroidetes bacterium]|nr:transketolase [Bacteroidota bacterium]MCL5026919.1 transketolase [Chloroflexota bacterium]
MKDIIDQLMDLMFNYRQSGHPGGSRSKVHALLVAMFSGISRWDIRHPEKRFGDRFILVGGHTVPLAYATLAVCNEALRVKYEQTGDPRYLVPKPEERMLTWEDLMGFRRNKGLSGHAEMEGKTLFLKFNTGPSAHGLPAAAGEAVALKRAGASGVKVIAFEGDGGLTPGGVHETQNSAWGLGLDNLLLIVDWNNYGIDDQPISSVVNGGPDEWFGAHGWRVFGTPEGSDWASVSQLILEATMTENPNHVPTAAWVKTRKGRGYGVFDNKSHGAPHPMNCDLFWNNARIFGEKYDVEFDGFCELAPSDPQALRQQYFNNLKATISALRKDQDLVDYLADRLVELGESVPEHIPTFCLNTRTNPWKDPRVYDFEHYPAEMFVKPGSMAPNRAALAKWGAWVNAFGKKEYDRPMFIACAADLAASTQINGFGLDFSKDMPGWGTYNRDTNPEGSLLPQEITEFANAGIMVGMASVNFAENPFEEFQGFYGATSTYGSFVYLHYGLMRLYSQMAQDCQFKLGKVLWVAGHSGPETAEDSRTHFGIFAPGVCQLFPQGHVVDVHPWEHNEVPVVIAAALKQPAPIVALHLTRPPIQIPDREALGIPSHFAAAKGAYIMRDYKPGQKPMGVVLVRGTSTTSNMVKVLPELDKAGLNVKVVAAISSDLFRVQPAEYLEKTLSETDLVDAMVVTNCARRLMRDWGVPPANEEYALSSDWDNRWRTGGSVDELTEEAHISPNWILAGIERFARDREKRLKAMASLVEAAQKR